MKVKQLLGAKGREVVTSEADNTVEDAIRSMQGRNISALLVTERGRPVGIFTERDVLRCYLGAGGRLFAEIPLREVMTTNLVVAELDDELNASGIEFCFAEMKDPVKDKLKRFGLFKRFGEKSFFATVGEAVNAYLEAHPVEWTDWEERQ